RSFSRFSSPHQRAQRGNGREWLACEEPGQGRTLELAFEVDRACDVERAQAGRVGAKEVRLDAIADGENALPWNGPPREAIDGFQGTMVDRRMGLARIDDLSALGGVRRGERAGTVDEPAAALDAVVGIGADHRNSACQQCRKKARVVGG